MAALDSSTPETRFDSFDIHTTSYKKVGDHEIQVAILVPKNLKPGKHPVIVKFHGGGLVTGDCLYPDWFAAFLIPFIHRNNAILVMPNYRLIPEHTGADVLSDLSSFWTWLHSSSFPTYVASHCPSVSLDLSHVCVVGDSAGGYMALMSGLTQPQSSIRAILAQYPMTYYLRGIPDSSMPVPASSFVDDHISALPPNTVISGATPPDRALLSLALSAHERYLDFFGNDNSMWPLYRIGEVKELPPTWIVHGDNDTAVDVQDSNVFVERCEGYGVDIKFEVREGMEHGFDIGMKESEEAWLKEGLEWLEKKWMA